MKQCKCEHWQQCPTCMPHRFDEEGNLKPPDPTPLQAARAEVEALKQRLFEMQNAAIGEVGVWGEYVLDCPRCGHCCQQREWVGLTDDEWYEATSIPRNATLPIHMLKAIEAKLKEKNT